MSWVSVRLRKRRVAALGRVGSVELVTQIGTTLIARGGVSAHEIGSSSRLTPKVSGKGTRGHNRRQSATRRGALSGNWEEFDADPRLGRPLLYCCNCSIPRRRRPCGLIIPDARVAHLGVS
ncbi:hypothetical protein R1flu_017968 [Riccia fluitans]|uniref:Uncharacterized protein n=1 Tax=Riccia fluitans TaxID=41844 RepID=A0ABD1ZES5_9MARC